jgi:hypothetical protein
MNNNLNIAPTQTKTIAATFQPFSGWIETKPKNPCPICGNKRWCSISRDGAIAHCKKIPSAHPDKSGIGWTHILDNSTSQRAAAPVKKVEIAPSVPKASPEHRHAVYTALLNDLKLSPQHHQNLVKRGLSEREIATKGYKSFNQLTDPVVEQLSKDFDLSGVAGFYQKNGRWLLNPSSKAAGFLVPYRDESGKISGLQIRTDKGKPKNFWLSSPELPKGASSGTPAHFVNVESAKASGKILLTEGAIKADVISHFTGEAVCALAGTAKVPDDLPERLVRLGIEKAVIAFDSDFRTNPAVSRFVNHLGEALMGAGIKCRVRLWDPEKGKGLDDFLAAGYSLREAEDLSFLQFRKRFLEPSLSTLKAAYQAKMVDEVDGAKPITADTERGCFHHYAEIATLLSTVMRLAGFSTCSQRFVETVVKTCGLRSELTSFRDVDLAQMAGYEPEIKGKDATTNTKTIQRWRNKYKTEADQLNRSLIEIVLPEYNFETKSFTSGKYRIHPDLINVLEDAIEHLYSISGYEKSVNKRRDAIRKTAEKFFRELPVGRIGERGNRASRRKSINELDKLQRISNAAQKLMDEHQLTDEAQSHLQRALIEIEAAISLQQRNIKCPRSFKEIMWTTDTESRTDQSADSAQKQVDTLSSRFAQKEDISPEVAAPANTPDESSQIKKQVDTLSSRFAQDVPPEQPEQEESRVDKLSTQVSQAAPSDNAPPQPPEELCSFCEKELPDGSIILENSQENLKSCPSCHRKTFTYHTVLVDGMADYRIKKPLKKCTDCGLEMDSTENGTVWFCSMGCGSKKVEAEFQIC